MSVRGLEQGVPGSDGDVVGIGKTFRPYAPDQIRLMPANLAEWLPTGHLARFVDEAVGTLVVISGW